MTMYSPTGHAVRQGEKLGAHGTSQTSSRGCTGTRVKLQLLILIQIITMTMAASVPSHRPADNVERRTTSRSARIARSLSSAGAGREVSGVTSVRGSPRCLPILPTERNCCYPSATRDCDMMEQCRRSMCGGTIPLACLSRIGQRGPHESFRSHRPFFVIKRQGGYGISVGRGFNPAVDGTAEPSVSLLATTDLTEVEIDLTELQTVGSAPRLLKVTLEAQGDNATCAQHRAELKVKVQCTNNVSKKAKKVVLTFDAKSRPQYVDLDLLGCTSLQLTTSLTVTSGMAFSLRRSCYVLWRDVQIIAPRSPSQCDFLCGEVSDVPLSCLQGQERVLPSNPRQVETAHRPAENSNGNGSQPNLNSEIIHYSLSPGSAPLRPRGNGRESGDMTLILDKQQTRGAYQVDIQTVRKLGKKFDFLAGKLHVSIKRPEQQSDCLRDAIAANVQFEVLVNKKVVWRRAMSVTMARLETNHSLEDIGNFAVDVWKVRMPRTITLKAELTSSSRRQGSNGNCSFGVAASYRAAQLRRQVKPPQFLSGCQESCHAHQQRGDGIIYLSCFLGARPKHRAGKFSCSGSITGRNNSFVSVCTNGGKGRVGVDRAGAWTNRGQDVALITPDGRQNVTEFEHAIGAHPNTRVTVSLTAFREMGQVFNTFSSVVGLDVRSGCERRYLTSVLFEVWLDRKFHYQAEVSHAYATREINIDVSQALEMTLVTVEGRLKRKYSNCRPAVWANARLLQLEPL